MSDDLIQVVVPGVQEVRLAEVGDYTIFHEYRSVIGNEIFSGSQGVSGLLCKLTASKTGKEIPLSPASGSSHYEFGGREGAAAFEFRIDEAGTYRLEAHYEGGREGPKTVLAISHGFMKDLLMTIFPAIGILFGSIATAVVIVVVTILKRRGLMTTQKNPSEIT